ncbi:hypothetical protein SD70_23725 [Gordoniibacillus kamchatkensis]|uniref:Uncharacterized protein n=1 Tax=Gordoniibacillus kamchatkensis TaxID=1590651 RepID=A0ABR5ACV7_9BACL|nr:hypothetical protein [Paenibacillus sp. VKM B-2647]KIL38874.1 hypothetical protein SD70_23725 [Paenibacillus sp. VKM B-2647]
MSEEKERKDNVIDLESFRRKSAAAGGAGEHVWEQVTLPLLPGSETPDQPTVHIVKVSSGFGRLPSRAWQDTVRSMAA